VPRFLVTKLSGPDGGGEATPIWVRLNAGLGLTAVVIREPYSVCRGKMSHLICMCLNE
jgi:hypothetical protein